MASSARAGQAPFATTPLARMGPMLEAVLGSFGTQSGRGVRANCSTSAVASRQSIEKCGDLRAERSLRLPPVAAVFGFSSLVSKFDGASVWGAMTSADPSAPVDHFYRHGVELLLGPCGQLLECPPILRATGYDRGSGVGPLPISGSLGPA